MTGGTLTAVIHDAGPSPGSGKWSGRGCGGSTRGVSGDLPRKKNLIIDTCTCVLMHFGSFWGPRISVILAKNLASLT